jgi:hypothetical protein
MHVQKLSPVFSPMARKLFIPPTTSIHVKNELINIKPGFCAEIDGRGGSYAGKQDFMQHVDRRTWLVEGRYGFCGARRT